MSCSRISLAVVAGLAVVGLTLFAAQDVDGTGPTAPSAETMPPETAGGRPLPLVFEPNLGQTSSEAEFLARTSQLRVALDATGLLLSGGTGQSARTPDGLRPRLGPARAGADLRIDLVGANADGVAEPSNPLPGRVHYLAASRAITDVPTHDAVTYRQVYPGIDATYRGADGSLVLDLAIAADADPTALALEILGTEQAGLEAGGLAARLGTTEVRLGPPAVLEPAGATASWIPVAGSSYGIGLFLPDPRTAALVRVPVSFIDADESPWPGLDGAPRLAVASDGRTFVTGRVAVPTVPVPSERGERERAGTGSRAGSDGAVFRPGDLIDLADAFVIQLAPDRRTVLQTTYFGDSGADTPLDLAIDAAGRVVVAGQTTSPALPGDSSVDRARGGTDAFVARIAPDGVLEASMILGGSGDDAAHGIALDDDGTVWIAGRTTSADLPVTESALAPRPLGGSDGLLMALDPSSGLAARYTSYLGGAADDAVRDLALDASGRPIVAGTTRSADFAAPDDEPDGSLDGFVVAVDPERQALAWSSRIGGAGDDDVAAIAIDGAGRIVLAGTSRSADLPLVSPVQPGLAASIDGTATDGFIAVLDGDGAGVLFSTYLGGSGNDRVSDVAVDAAGRAWIAGVTDSTDFPVAGASSRAAGGSTDAFVAEIDIVRAELLRATHVGGTDGDAASALALLPEGGALVAGATRSEDLVAARLEHSAVGGDAFLAQIAAAPRALGCPGAFNFDNGGGDNLWQTPANWDTGTVPSGATADVCINGFNVTLSSGTQNIVTLKVQGAGSLTITGGTLDISGEADIDTALTLTNGTIGGTGSVNVDGLFTWSGFGTLGGTGNPLPTFTAAGGTVITTTNSRSLNRIFVNPATETVSWQEGHLTLGVNGAQIDNAGTWVAELPGDYQLNGAATLRPFNNTGTFRKATPVAGTVGTTYIDTQLVNSGTVDVEIGMLSLRTGGTYTGSMTVDAGTTLFFSGGTHNLNSGSSLTAPGNVNVTAGTVNVSGTATFSVSGDLTLSGGDLNFSNTGTTSIDDFFMSFGGLGGTSNVTVGGLFTWNGYGTLGGTGNPLPTFTAAGGTVITTTNSRSLNRIFVNPATETVSWQEGHLTLGVNGAQIDNAGTWVAELPGDYQLNGAATLRPFNNTGTFRKATPLTGTVGTTYIDTQLVNSGTVDVEIGMLSLRTGGTYTGSMTVDAGTTLFFSGGTHNLNSGSSLTAPGNVHVTAGTVNVSGTATFGVSGDLTLSGGDLNFSNTGTTSIDDFFMSFGSLGGTSNVTVGGLFTWNGYGTLGGTGNPLPTFTASGGTAITTTHSRSLNRIFVNPATETVSWQEGHLTLGVNGAQIDNAGTWVAELPGDYQLNGAATLRPFNNTGTFRKATPLTGTVGTTYIDTQLVNSGTVTVEVGALSLRTAGTYTGSMTVDPGTTLFFSGGTHNLNSGSSLTAPGNVNVTAGAVNVSGTATFGVSGDLTLSGGDLNFSNTGTTSIDDFFMSFGSLGGTSNLTIGGLFTWNGYGTLGGTGNPLPTFTASGGTAITTTHSRSLNRIFVNPAMETVSWQEGHLTLGVNGAQIDNAGTWVAELPGDYQLNGAATLRPFNNTGTFRKATPLTGTVGTTYIDTQLVNSGTVTVEVGALSLRTGGTYTGSMTVDPGTTLFFSGGTHNLNSGSSLTAPGNVNVTAGAVNVSGTATFGVSGDLTLSGGDLNFSNTGTTSIDDFFMSFGNFGGTSNVTIGGLFTWNGYGTLGGTGNPLPTFTASGGTAITTTHSRSLNRIFVNPATETVSWQEGHLTLGVNGAQIDNAGTWVAEHPGLYQINGTPANRPFNNAGTFRKIAPVAGTVDESTMNTQYVNTGTTTVEAGMLHLQNGGTYTGGVTVSPGAQFHFAGGTHNLNTGSILTSSGQVEVQAGTANLNGTASLNVTDLRVTFGTLNVSSTGTVSIGDFFLTFGSVAGTSPVTISGLFTWSGYGDLGGTGSPLPTFTAAGGTVIDTTSGRTVNRVFVNPPGQTVMWRDGTVGLNVDGARIDNQGTWRAEHPSDQSINGIASRLFNNTGTFLKVVPAAGTVGTTTVNTGMTNAGTVEVQAGTFAPTSAYTQTAGTTLLNGGDISGSVALSISGGSLKGAGTVTAPTVNLNGGQVEPGLSPGILEIVGDYVQAPGGTYALEIGGLTPGTQHDQLNILDASPFTDSDALLAGTLSINLVNGFTPTIGDTLTILTAENVVPGFTNVTTTPPLGCGVDWGVTYNATSAVLQFMAVASADLEVSMSDAPDPVAVGDTLTYTVIVSNAGPETAAGVVLTDTLPGGVTFVSAGSTQGSCSNASGTVTCTIGTLADGASATVTIQVTPDAPGNLTNSATATSDSCDPVPGNDTDTSDTTARPACADVDADGSAVCDASCTPFASDQCGDCSDTEPNCSVDCSDNNGNTTPDCAEICPDVDGDDFAACDGACGLASGDECGDCDDTDAAVKPGATEITGDGVDQDCEGTEVCYTDADDDGYRPDATATVASTDADCNDAGEAVASDPTGDCNDAVGAINPGAAEIAGDGVDQDCDAAELCFVDADNDDYRPDATATVASTDLDCVDSGEAVSTDATGDCNDAVGAIHPGATEIAGDGVDQDCDAAELCFVDVDDDGYRPNSTATVVSADLDCVDSGEAVASDPTGDCNDVVATIHPGATEIAGDGIDQDCNGTELCFTDADNDGYRPNAAATVASADLDCVDAGEAVASDPTEDCNDAVATIHPGATEGCNGMDDDCDNAVPASENDGDGDGVRICAGDCDDTLPTCAADCSDTNGNTTPDCAEVCPDTDSDGFAICDEVCGLVTGDLCGDCNDTNPAIHPAATEAAGDGVDQDCDAAELCFVDADNDGHRPNATSTVESVDTDCVDAGEAVSTDATGDCNDADGAIHPGATEIAGDSVDQNCDGAELCFVDADNDGHRPNATSTVASADTDCLDSAEAGASDPTEDCNDAVATIHPGATEIAGDGVDQNCDGAELCFTDADNDGHRPNATATVNSADPDCVDAGEAIATDPTGDCNDTAAAIRPGATEIAADGVDQDCDGAELCFTDADNDGHRPNTTATVDSSDPDCVDTGEAIATDPTGDCNDAVAAIHPGATEIAGDSLDQNCDGAELCFTDADNDGHRPNTTSTVASTDTDCLDAGEAVAGDPTNDCDDGDPAIHPGVTESGTAACADGEDNDCDGATDTADLSCAVAVTSCATLGDQPAGQDVDQDVWTFQGQLGEAVSVMLAANGTETGHADLVLVDELGAAVDFFHIDRSDLPNTISTTLPAAGVYRLAVVEHPAALILPGRSFRGDYCVTLDGNLGAAQSLAPTSSVEAP